MTTSISLRFSSSDTKRIRAFTLVELLVVIGIIALLISILLPSLSAARERGNAIKCLSNLRQLGMAFQMYANENQNYYPAGSRHTTVRDEDWLWWQEKKAPATGGPPPAAGRPVLDPGQSRIAPYIGGFNEGVLRCPSDPIEAHSISTPSGIYRYSYAMNENFESVHQFKKVRVSQIKNSTRKILLFEQDENAVDDGLFGPGTGDLTSTAAKDLLGIRHDRKKVLPDDRTQAIGTHANADRRGNASFVDGHAEYISRKEAHSAECILPNK